MTINEAITALNAIKPNKISSETKISWLSTCDSAIFSDIISTHEDAETEEFEGYSADTDTGTVLLVGAPHNVLYRFFLEMNVDLANMELAKYNNTKSLFNAAYADYAAYYNRSHMPLSAATHIKL